MSSQNPQKSPDSQNLDTVDDFDLLWEAPKKDQTGSVEAEQVAQKLKENKSQENFEVIKTEWQLAERNKELSRLYQEMSELLEMNRGLNEQLVSLNKIHADYMSLQDFSAKLSDKLYDCESQVVELKAELEAERRKAVIPRFLSKAKSLWADIMG